MNRSKLFYGVLLSLGLAFLFQNVAVRADSELLNVSYDSTRELYVDFNEAFKKYYKNIKNGNVSINTSHGGSSRQARTVIDGIHADVVTLGLSSDIDQIAAAGLLDKNWQERLPDNSTHYTSTIVSLVGKGNPRNINDWDDLIKKCRCGDT